MSSYSPNLKLELISTGTQAGVWGTTTNTNLGTLIEQAISGYVTQVCTGGTDTITIPDGATGVARNMFLELTGTGGGTLVVPSNKKLYFIYNNTGGGAAVTVKVSGQTGVSVPDGKKILLVSNGTDVVVATNYMVSPTFVTPALGTPASGTLTNTTGFPVANLAGAGTGVLTALGVNVGSAGAPVVNGGVLGTPSAGTLTNATGLPISTGVSGLGTGVATFLATPSSANLASAVTGETGSGALVFGTSPTIDQPTITTSLNVGYAPINTNAFTIVEYGGSLQIKYGATVLMTIDSLGNVSAVGNITAYEGA